MSMPKRDPSTAGPVAVPVQPAALASGQPVQALASDTTHVPPEVRAEAAAVAEPESSQPHLRAVYHEVLNEPVPDRFVRLLEALATKQAGRA
jgi:Anti-sigma factor NepR